MVVVITFISGMTNIEQFTIVCRPSSMVTDLFQRGTYNVSFCIP